MFDNLSSYSVRELHLRYISEARMCSNDTLLQMREDPRRGVQRIYLQLRRRRERILAESRRLDRMLVFERELWSSGVLQVAGVDEAGLGPLAGPVVAAAVIVPVETLISGVNDSKRLDADKRLELAQEIKRVALSVSVGISGVEEIDRLNVYHAGLLAMSRAVSGLSVEPDHILVDGRVIPGLSAPQRRLVKGDQRSFVIAAASIIAKTHRDQLMRALDDEYPGYGFGRHKGYGTAEHRSVLERLGPVAPHRRSFSPVRGVSKDLFGDLVSREGNR